MNALRDQVAPATGCVPGRDGIPGSLIGKVLCGTWGQDAPGAVWGLLRVHWPLVAAVAAMVVLAAIGWRRWRRRVWRDHARQARWLQVTPPVTATPAATVGLWRLLATALPAPRRWALRPPRIVWEVEADAHGMRCGFWIPPGMNPTAVMRLLQRAWPGTRVEQAGAPRPATQGAVVALAVTPTQPEWLPLVEAAPTQRRWDTANQEEDRLRAVYDGLASAGRTGGGLLQVHISRAPAGRVRALRRAITSPTRAHKARGASRAIGLLADALRALTLFALDAVTPGPSARRRGTIPTDPYAAELARQARTKYASAPHLLIAIRATACGPTTAAAQAAAADITSGFGLLSAHFTRRRAPGGPAAAADRWVAPAAMTLASVEEAAALAALPGEPAAYGLPGAASRRRPPSREVFRPQSTATPAGPATPAPQVWSTP
jgi:hypothetical protein